MGEPCKAVHVSHGLGQGAEDVGGGGDDRASETAGSLDSGVVSSGSLCSSRSSLTDDATSPLKGDRKSSSSSSSDSMQLDGDGGPLYELSPLLAHLPDRNLDGSMSQLKTGLSKYYRGKSQSFTSLTDAKCVQDLAKKTMPYNSRMKACRGYAAAGLGANRSSNSRYVPGPRSKTITKKTRRGSSDRLLSRGRGTSLFYGSGKPPEMGHLSTGVRISPVSMSSFVNRAFCNRSFQKQVFLSYVNNLVSVCLVYSGPSG